MFYLIITCLSKINNINNHNLFSEYKNNIFIILSTIDSLR